MTAHYRPPGDATAPQGRLHTRCIADAARGWSQSAPWADTPPIGAKAVGPRRGRHGAGCAGGGPGPRSPFGGPPVPRGARPPRTRSGVRACSGAAPLALPLRGPLRFLRTPRPPLRRGLRPLRASAPARPARPPLRGPGPAHGARPPLRSVLRGRAPGAAPRLSRSAACAPLRGSAGARWPRCAWGRLPLCCGLPPLRSGRPCSAPPPRCASRGPAGSPRPRPLRGFGPGGLRSGGLRGPSGRLLCLRPPPLCGPLARCSRAPARAALPSSGLLRLSPRC